MSPDPAGDGAERAGHRRHEEKPRAGESPLGMHAQHRHGAPREPWAVARLLLGRYVASAPRGRGDGVLDLEHVRLDTGSVEQLAEGSGCFGELCAVALL